MDGRANIPWGDLTGDGQSSLRAGLSEFLGSLLFVFLGASVISLTGNIDSEAVNCTRIVLVALVDGLLFHFIIYLTQRLSDGNGGYVNPTVTISLAALDTYFDGKAASHVGRALFYIAAQCAGSVVGAFLVLSAQPDPLVGLEKIGKSRPSFGTRENSAFWIEFILAYFLVIIILAVRRNERRRSSLIIGLTYMTIRLFSFPLTQGFVNPARALGPAIVGNGWRYLWLYVLAPVIGSLFGTFTFIYLHRKSLEMDRDYQLDEDEA
eukprot:TRINITY_DN66123_c7_g1_i2.p1 TRINITY_DN66123_c7_g1~~TRINITY_DN66123_c7_g1_i2.p1  ORF type:complete len:265 (+),score=117.95 TRINITY_DN66123_c7_g1_i2:69-863(+)